MKRLSRVPTGSAVELNSFILYGRLIFGEHNIAGQYD